MTSDNSPDYDLYIQATVRAEAGDLTTAKRLYLDSYAIQPHAKTAHRLACIYETLREDEQAVTWAKTAFEMNSTMSDVATNWARWLVRLSRQDEAIDVLSRVLSRHTCYGPAKNLLDSLNSGGLTSS